MLIEYTAHEYASVADMRRNYDAIRTRFASPPVQHGIEPEQAPSETDPPGSDEGPPPVPALAIREIVDAVCVVLAMPRDQLLSDITSIRAIDGRRIAAALIVRRLCITRQVVAEHFGIVEGAVCSALTRLDLTMIARAIPRNADLLATVRVVVEDWNLDRGARPTLTDIKRAVCAEFKVSAVEIESIRRDKEIVAARMVAMAITKRLTSRSFPYIGEQFGGRDHTTVLHAFKKMRPFIAAAAAVLPDTATVDEWARAVRKALEVEA